MNYTFIKRSRLLHDNLIQILPLVFIGHVWKTVLKH